jgi:hypothetical protein
MSQARESERDREVRKYWEELGIAKTYVTKIVSKGFIKASEMSEKDIKELCKSRVAQEKLLEQRRRELEEESEEMVNESEQDKSTKTVRNKTGFEQAVELVQTEGIEIEWLEYAESDDIKELAKGNIKLKMAMQFIRSKLRERKEKREEISITTKEFKMPRQLPRWNGKNYTEFIEDVEIAMIAEGIDFKYWLRVMMKCTDSMDARRINSDEFHRMEWDDAKKELRCILEPQFNKSKAVYELVQTRPKEHETIKDYCKRYWNAFCDAECEDSPKEAETFINTLPFGMRKIIHHDRVDSKTGKLRELVGLEEAFELVANLFPYRDTVLERTHLRKTKVKIPRKEVTCFKCKTKGHISVVCPQIQCFQCGKFGHIASNCVNKPSIDMHRNKSPKSGKRVSSIKRVYNAETYKEDDESDEEAVITPVVERTVRMIHKGSTKLPEAVSKSNVEEKWMDTRLYVPVMINGIEIRAMLDTGANCSIIDANVCKKYQWPVVECKEEIRLANGSYEYLLGKVEVKLVCGKKEVTTTLWIMEIYDVHMILGMDLFNILQFGLINVPTRNGHSNGTIVYDDVTDPIVPEGEMENDSVKVSVTKALKDNLKTDGKFCNFPSSEVRLLIPEDKAVFKRQYKIPMVY